MIPVDGFIIQTDNISKIFSLIQEGCGSEQLPLGVHTQEVCSPDEVGQLLLVERGIGK